MTAHKKYLVFLLKEQVERINGSALPFAKYEEYEQYTVEQLEEELEKLKQLPSIPTFVPDQDNGK